MCAYPSAHAGETRSRKRAGLARRAHPCARRGDDITKRMFATVQGTSRAHPCARRGDRMTNATSYSSEGTSLRTQGRLIADVKFPDGEWHIPAHAGETCAGTTARTPFRAHPCARRGDSSPSVTGASDTGTSLRTQGRPSCNHLQLHNRGHIPANAGETASLPAGRGGPGAHPCARRGDMAAENRRIHGIGTSLRTQGRQHRRTEQRGHHRHIPAHAGETTANPYVSAP